MVRGSVGAAVLAAAALVPAAAWGEGHAVGLKVGVLGAGVEYTHDLTDRIALRGTIHGSKIGLDVEESDIEYEADLVWDSLAVGVDIHPLKTPLRLSVGLLKSDNRFELSSRPTGNVEIGDEIYTPAEVGTLEGAVRFDDTAPFFGIGWDWSRKKRLFGMSLDIGVVDQGDIDVTLRSTGPLLNDPNFQDDIEAEIERIEEDADPDFLPFISVGFQFRF